MDGRLECHALGHDGELKSAGVHRSVTRGGCIYTETKTKVFDTQRLIEPFENAKQIPENVVVMLPLPLTIMLEPHWFKTSLVLRVATSSVLLLTLQPAADDLAPWLHFHIESERPQRSKPPTHGDTHVFLLPDLQVEALEQSARVSCTHYRGIICTTTPSTSY